MENDCDPFEVLDDETGEEQIPGLRIFFCSQILDDTHYVFWAFHNLPKDAVDSGYRFVISIESELNNGEAGDGYYQDSLKYFEGPVLPSEATAESVKESGQGLAVEMDYMRERLTSRSFTGQKVYHCTFAVKKAN